MMRIAHTEGEWQTILRNTPNCIEGDFHGFALAPELLLRTGVATTEQLKASRGGIADRWQRRCKAARVQAEDSGYRKYVDECNRWPWKEFENEAVQAGGELSPAESVPKTCGDVTVTDNSNRTNEAVTGR